jgi:hypothetical protein
MHDCTHTNTWVVHAVRGSRGGWGGGGGGGGKCAAVWGQSP